MNLPEVVLHDNWLWGFQQNFHEASFLDAIKSPRRGEMFDGQTLASLVRGACKKYDIAQPFIMAKLIGETGFLTLATPAGKAYHAPLGFDCPDGGRDPRDEYLGVAKNIAGGTAIWRTYATDWDLERRMRDGMVVNLAAEGEPVQRGHVTPRTKAEAAYLIYTPHVYSLHDFVKLMQRYFPEVVSPKPVASQVSEWAEDALGRMKAFGVTDGSDPQGTCTREMVWVMLDRLFAKVQGGEG